MVPTPDMSGSLHTQKIAPVLFYLVLYWFFGTELDSLSLSWSVHKPGNQAEN